MGGGGGGGVGPTSLIAKVGPHPGRVASLAQGQCRETNTHPHSCWNQRNNLMPPVKSNVFKVKGAGGNQPM